MLMSQIRTRPTARIEIPLQFSRLRDMAYNLWWTWSPRAHKLFYTIDPARWVHYRNPIELLVDLDPERWHRLQSDPEFIRAYRQVIERFDSYVAPEEPTWFEQLHPSSSRMGRSPTFPPSSAGTSACKSTPADWACCPETTARRRAIWGCLSSAWG